MAVKTYFTAGQAKLLLGGYVLDDAHSINVEVQDSKTPVYGFRSETFDAIMFGRTIVYGVLDINFRYKGYLFQTIARSTTAQENIGDLDLYVDMTVEIESELLSTWLDPNDLFDADAKAEALSNAAASSYTQHYEAMKSAIKDDMWGRTKDPEGTSDIESKIKDKDYRKRLLNAINKGGDQARTRFSNRAMLARAGVMPDPIQLTILYGSSYKRPQHIETPRDVYFMSQSKVVSAAVNMSDSPLLERYQFIARTID